MFRPYKSDFLQKFREVVKSKYSRWCTYDMQIIWSTVLFMIASMYNIENIISVMLCLTITWGVVKDQPPFPSNLSRTDRALQVVRWYDYWSKKLLISFFSRCIISCIHCLAAYFAIQQMPLSVQKMILSARPIFTVFFARIFLKEAFGVFEVKSSFKENTYI